MKRAVMYLPRPPTPLGTRSTVRRWRHRMITRGTRNAAGAHRVPPVLTTATVASTARVLTSAGHKDIIFVACRTLIAFTLHSLPFLRTAGASADDLEASLGLEPDDALGAALLSASAGNLDDGLRAGGLFRVPHAAPSRRPFRIEQE